MAFCTICGKQLADGEVCTCQQNNAQSVPQGSIPQGMPYTGAPQQGSPYTAAYGAPQQEAPKSSVDMGGAFKKAIDHIKNTVKKPITAAEEYYENGTIPSSAVLIGILTIAYVFATVLNLISKIFYALSYYKKSVKIYYKPNGLTYGEYLDLKKITRWDILNDYSINVGTIFQSIFFPIIYIVLMGATVFGLFYLIDAVVLKKKTDVNKIASLCGAVSVPLIGAIAVKILYNFIHVGALRGFFFPIFIVCMSVLTAIQGFTILSKEIKDRKQLVISLAILVAGLVTVEYLIGLFLYKSTTFFALPGVPFVSSEYMGIYQILKSQYVIDTQTFFYLY